MKKRKAQEQIRTHKPFEPLLYLAPFFLGVIIFTLYPFIRIILISFMEDYKYISHTFSSIGLGNYTKIFSDPYFHSALKNTGIYVLWVVPLSLCLGLCIAVLLNRNIKLQGLFQTCYFLPITTSVTALGLVWKWIFNYDYGILNYLLSLFGMAPINWLNDPDYGMMCIVMYGTWSILPITIILLLAGLQNINPQYAVAAKVDGAKNASVFFRITLPLMAPQIGLVMIVNVITTSKVFNELFPLFNGRPGVAGSLYTLIYYIYDCFYTKWQLGPAAASAMILFVIVFLLTMLQLFVQRKWKNY